jgi:hypothetical protein
VPVWTGLAEGSLPGLQMATFLLCLHTGQTDCPLVSNPIVSCPVPPSESNALSPKASLLNATTAGFRVSASEFAGGD